MTTQAVSGVVAVSEEPQPPAEDIKDQLERILGSSEFIATKAQRALLRYVVEKKISGKEIELKGYTIATEVFGRGKDFSQATDPVVSIQAGKLRRALERYYLVAGQADRIFIDIPKGTYIPRIGFRYPGDQHSSRRHAQVEKHSWPRLSILPFRNLTGDPVVDTVGYAIGSELALEVIRSNTLEVCRFEGGDEGADGGGKRDVEARFRIQGCLKRDKDRFKVDIFMMDRDSGLQVWADHLDAGASPVALLRNATGIARRVAGKLCAENGIIARHLGIELKQNKGGSSPGGFTSYNALLKYQQFSTSFTAEAFAEALRALKTAVEAAPDCGLIWSMLARLFATNYAVELSPVETPIDKAVHYAQTSVGLDPANQKISAGFAYVLMLAGECRAARKEVERALDLQPDSIVIMDSIGYLLTLLGDWDRGTMLIRRAIRLNPYYNPIVHHALWLDLFRRKQYEEAHLESLRFRTPQLFWDHLLKASTLGRLGKLEKGRLEARRILDCKPDFPQKGERLIRHFIHDEQIVRRLLDGLHRLGSVCGAWDGKIPR